MLFIILDLTFISKNIAQSNWCLVLGKVKSLDKQIFNNISPQKSLSQGLWEG